MQNQGKQGYGIWLSFGAAFVAACSVDTSDIRFVDDDVIDRFEDGEGGEDSGGGVLNTGGVLNQAGKIGGGGVGVAGKPAGGAPVGGVSGGGRAGMNAGGVPVGGMNAGGMPVGGMNAGGAPPMGYPCTERKTPDKIIANFTGLTSAADAWFDSTKAVQYGFFAYPQGNMPPNIKLGDGSLTIEASRVAGSMGVGIWFSPCVDAKAPNWTAISFVLSGGRRDGKQLLLRVGVNTNETQMADPKFRTGNCVPPNQQAMMMGYCRPPVTEVKVTTPMPPGTRVVVPFASLGDGSPVMKVDTGQLTSVEWGFIFLNGDPAYDAAIVVDDVTFQ